MSTVRSVLPGSSMVEHSLGLFPGIVRRIYVIHGPGAYPVDLHDRFLFGPGKMVGLGLHNGHTPPITLWFWPDPGCRPCPG